MRKSEHSQYRNTKLIQKFCNRNAEDSFNTNNKLNNRDKETTKKQLLSKAKKVKQQKLLCENSLKSFKIQLDKVDKGKQLHDNYVKKKNEQIDDHDIENKRQIGEDHNDTVQVNEDYNPQKRSDQLIKLNISFINNLQRSSQVSREYLGEILGMLCEIDSNFEQDLSRLNDPNLPTAQRKRIQKNICNMIDKIIQRANEQTRIDQMETRTHNIHPQITIQQLFEQNPILQIQLNLIRKNWNDHLLTLSPQQRQKDQNLLNLDYLPGIKLKQQGKSNQQPKTTTKSDKKNYKFQRLIAKERFKQQITKSFNKGLCSTALIYGIKTGMDVFVKKKDFKQSTKDNLKQSSSQLLGLVAGKTASLLMPKYGNQIGQVISQAIPFISNKQNFAKIKQAYRKKFKKSQNQQ